MSGEMVNMIGSHVLVRYWFSIRVHYVSASYDDDDETRWYDNLHLHHRILDFLLLENPVTYYVSRSSFGSGLVRFNMGGIK